MSVYNKEARLKESISSVLSQSFQDFELIIINDGSTDKSGEICEYFRKKDSRVRVYHQENKGVSYTRNLSIKMAETEFISFLDADDTYEKTFLENMLRKIGNKDVCYCGHFYIGNKKRKAKINFKSGFILMNYLKNTTTPNTNSWLIRKSFLLKHDLLFREDLNFGEDMLFFANLLKQSKDVQCVKKRLTNYHLEIEGSLSENNIDKINLDLKWMNILINDILHSKLLVEEKMKLTKIMINYRIPGGIIYRVYQNCEFLIENNLLEEIILNNTPHIVNLKSINGIRSLKLIYFKKKILKIYKNRILHSTN